MINLLLLVLKIVKKFFWLVGQGGYGIQTAPALAEISANLILKKKNNFFLNNSTMYNISIERIRKENTLMIIMIRF